MDERQLQRNSGNAEVHAIPTDGLTVSNRRLSKFLDELSEILSKAPYI
jgi:hypothetical protein